MEAWGSTANPCPRWQRTPHPEGPITPSPGACAPQHGQGQECSVVLSTPQCRAVGTGMGLLGSVGLTHSTPMLLLWAAPVPSSGHLCDIGMLGTRAGDGQNVLMAPIWAASCYFGGCDLMLRRCLWKHGRVTAGVVQSCPTAVLAACSPVAPGCQWGWRCTTCVCRDGSVGSCEMCCVSSGPRAGFSHEVFWPE